MPYRNPAPREEAADGHAPLAARFAREVRRPRFFVGASVGLLVVLAASGVALAKRRQATRVEEAYASVAACLDDHPTEEDGALARRMRARELAMPRQPTTRPGHGQDDASR